MKNEKAVSNSDSGELECQRRSGVRSRENRFHEVEDRGLAQLKGRGRGRLQIHPEKTHIGLLPREGWDQWEA